ncbi:daple-like protein [Nasonia vitripennis]|uniref:HOOK N-terminal domain-containing protein n=1 Tax=Nasonia vitripennis TaxID=7425 RepID=A0A7M7QET3_NASVI|nr:daple-like protein [Nasonia vitripennis]XP_031784522.1 daple-like protein [Nasonia vitripennis]XP_031784523.1 daple-like protein [Nasonia vitripennis]
MASSEINEFLCGPLVTWFISCLEDPNALTNYDDLVDGVLLHNVFLQIDPEPLHDGVIPSGGDSRVRIKNLEIVVDNMRQFYEEHLGHLLLIAPNTYKLGKDPERHVAEAKLMLLLLLGCAVQCSNKEDFITRIKTLNVDTQLAIVDCIKQVTDYQDIVVTQESMENVNMGIVFSRVKKLMQEKNAYCNKLKSIQAANTSHDNEGIGNCTGNDPGAGNRNNDNIVHNALEAERGDMPTPKKSGMSATSMSGKLEGLFSPPSNSGRDNSSSREDVHRYAVELADWKSKVRKQRQELEEKTEALIECKEELEHNKAVLVKLREENQELLLEARAAKSYRDELDAAIERAERADRLEAEVARYREKLTDIEYYKSRIEELREDNRVLMETREMLEEQLNSSRKRSEKVLELESEIIKYEQLLNDMALERVADRDKYTEVCEENAQLQRLIKSVASEVASGALSSLTGAGSASDSEADPTDGSTDNRLSEQLSNNAQARALKLELENRRLSNLVDSLKEKSFHESSSRMLELEKEKKKLSLKVDSLNDSSERLTQQNKDLELVCKQTLEENKKLQGCLSTQRSNLDKQQQEIQSLHGKLSELERNYESTIAKERQRLQTLLESAERRAEDAERNAASKERELNDLKLASEMAARELKEKQAEFESKLAALERDKEATHREVLKLRELVETKDVALDEASNTIEILEKKVAEFQQEIGNSAAQIYRLREIERSSKELDSRAAIDREALESLQSNLVAEKLNAQQVHATLEKLGLDSELALSLPADKILDMISEVPEVVNRVIQRQEPSLAQVGKVPAASAETEEQIKALQAASEVLQSEKAKLEVHVTRLESQSASLTSQQAALQLNNSRLEASMDQLVNEHSALERAHADLGRDQKRLQSLHEQLSTEYECLLRERDSLKVSHRDAKNEARLLRESSERLEAQCQALQTERDNLLADVKTLINLRGEHSKLREDFRNLYTNHETLKTQYRSLQEDYRKNKVENNRLSLRQTEMQGELSKKDDRLANLELQINKLSQRCEMLLQMNTGLDNDRRSLMEHISLLFSQYHELLTHSLDDKEHYHMEEKMYTDKMNHLHRQKEKLEEKIMEHYRKLDSCTTKKKSIGASFVRRVRKAGSGLFNRNSRRSSWSANTSALSDENSLKSSFANDGKVYDDEDDQDDEDNVEADLDEEAVQPHESNSSGDDSHIIEAGLDPESLRPDDPLSLAHPGTRRTVYYTDDASPSLTRTANQDKRAETDDPSMYQQQQQRHRQEPQRSSDNEQSYNEPRPLLIYNKVSAVINDSTTTTATPLAKKSMDDSKSSEKDLVEASNDKDRKTANSVWYEYGCV